VLRNGLFVVGVLLLTGCGSSTGPDVDLSSAFVTGPVEVTLQQGEDLLVPGTVLRVSLAAVAEDSRCPSDVVCVWEGNAKVELGIAAGSGPTSTLLLNTALEPRVAEWNGIRVTLVDVTPYPVSTQAILAGDYLVRLRLEREPQSP